MKRTFGKQFNTKFNMKNKRNKDIKYMKNKVYRLFKNLLHKTLFMVFINFYFLVNDMRAL